MSHFLSQREAARIWGVSRATIQRHLASGKLSKTTDKRIDPAEMTRVFGEPPGRPGAGPISPGESVVSRPDVSALEAEIAGLRALLDEKDARILDLRQTIQLIEHQGHQARPRGWWPWQKK